MKVWPYPGSALVFDLAIIWNMTVLIADRLQDGLVGTVDTVGPAGGRCTVIFCLFGLSPGGMTEVATTGWSFHFVVSILL